jgi:heptosyltransferase-2
MTAAADAGPLPRTAVLMRDVGIGDFVWHAPYFQRIAQLSAGGRVAVLAPPSTFARELVGHEPWVGEMLDFDRRPRRGERRRGRHGGFAGLLRLARELGALPCDRLVMFTGRSLPPALAGWWAGIPERIAYGTRPLHRGLLTRRRWIEPYQGPGVAAYWNAAALCRRHGWADGPLVPRLSVRPDALARMRDRLAALPRPLHALAIGSSEAFKQWGAERFAALARLLAARGGSVLLLGGAAEQALAQTILAQAETTSTPRTRLLALTQQPLAETVAALSLAQGCVGNDTGAANVAAAVGTPTWVLLGPRPPLEHDPQRLRMIRAARLEDIAPADVAAQVLSQTASASTAASRLA